MRKAGWLYHGGFSEEGDFVWVVPCVVDRPDDDETVTEAR